jgi:hypothetical protein
MNRYEYSAPGRYSNSLTIDGLDCDREVEVCVEGDYESRSVWLPEGEARRLCQTLSFMFGAPKDVKGTVLDASRVEELHSALLTWMAKGYIAASRMRAMDGHEAAKGIEATLNDFAEVIVPFEIEKP